MPLARSHEDIPLRCGRRFNEVTSACKNCRKYNMTFARVNKWTSNKSTKHSPVSIYLSIHLSIHPFVCLSAYLSIYLFIYPSIYLSTYPSSCLSTYLSVYLPIHLSVFPSICFALYLSMQPSTHQTTGSNCVATSKKCFFEQAGKAKH